MSAVPSGPMQLSGRGGLDERLWPWAIALAGFAAMYVPVYWWAANSIWQTDDHGHGPIILAVIVWLFWSMRHDIAAAETRPSPLLGGAVFGLGLLVYVVGRAFGISIFELGSQVLVVAGVFLTLKGKPAFKVAWFAIFYFIFMIPLPGILVDAITGPLKNWISVIVVESLHGVGYPIARSGVTITIGQYQMLVADACSGLHSMYSLSALGLLFMHMMQRQSRLHNVLMLVFILPIAFMANIVRVIVLVLVTYHLGDETGQGFLHGAAGMVLMLVALCIFFMFDSVLAYFIKPKPVAVSAD